MNKSGSDNCPASLAAKFLQNMERRNRLNFYLAHFEEITSLALIPLSLPVSQGLALPYNTLTTRLTSNGVVEGTMPGEKKLGPRFQKRTVRWV